MSAKVVFTAQSTNARWHRGFGSSGNICPSKWANKLFGAEIPGPWLLAYMIRRFGWPNIGSDDYKSLCSWQLTTPMEGLYLCVTPYLGARGDRFDERVSNLHFSILFHKKHEKEMYRDPGFESFQKRASKWAVKWWNGQRLYSFGTCKEGDTDETLVHEVNRRGGEICGFWEWRDEHARLKGRDRWLKNNYMAVWCLFEFLKDRHPEIKLPKTNKRERRRQRTRFMMQVESAVKAALRDLLRPTRVRDIYFTPFGDIERTEQAKAMFKGQKYIEYSEDAGYAAKTTRPRIAAEKARTA